MKKRLPIRRTTIVLSLIVLFIISFTCSLLSQNANKNALSVLNGKLLTSLSASTAYYHNKVMSADVTNNNITSATGGRIGSDFNLPPTPCVQDATAADFNLGTTDATTIVSNQGIMLKPALNEDFSGSTVPSGWASGNFNPGATTVTGGKVTVSGTHVYTNNTFGPGASIEFTATYNLGSYQNVGFSIDQPFDNNPWITIGQGQTADGNLYARSSDGTAVSLGSTLLGSSHQYRIQWNAGNFTFYVDGSSTPAATINATLTAAMYVQISDVQSNDGSLSVDWIRISPFSTSGTYTSRVFNQGSLANWGVVNWTASTPSGTSLDIEVRTGNTLIPDASWTSFALVTNGGSVGGSSQYIQYRVNLATTNNNVTPILQNINIECNAAPDVTPPVITNVNVQPSADGQSAVITWNTDESSNSAVYYDTSAGSLNYHQENATLGISHNITLTGLIPGTTYYYRESSSDASNNTATEPAPPAAPRSFVTPVPPCFVDKTATDFGGGTLTNAYISVKDDGEVTLQPSAGSEFTTLPSTSAWAAFSWTGTTGSSTVSGGQLSVDGKRFNNEPVGATFGPGSALEFVATFGASAFQHIGFGGGTDATTTTGGIFTGQSPWAMFSTGSSSTVLKARTSTNGSTSTDVDLGSFLGSAHLYRIEWAADGTFKYYIDGTLVLNQTSVTITAPMRVGISDFNAGGAIIKLDWIHVTPYTTPGTFESRVYNAGSVRHWDNISWTADVPAAPNLIVSVHAGNTPIPDGSWSAYTVISNGGAINTQAQYIQYKAELTTTNFSVTPVLKDVAVTCSNVVNTIPVVTTNPADKTVCTGSSVSFTSAATGTPAPAVQWQVSTDDGDKWDDINGATNSTLSFTASPADDGNQYRAVWTNVAGNDISSAATLTITPATAINQDPSGQTVCTGSDVTFSVTAIGTGLTYQWRKGGTDIENATGSSLALLHVTASDAGSYDVVVSGDCGGPATSVAASLVVNAAAAISQSPSGQAVCAGSDVTFSVTAVGAGLAYQWRKGGADIVGATSSSLTLLDVTTSDAGSYDVVVSGDCGAPKTSTAAVLVVNAGPAITQNPASTTVCARTDVTFNVTAAGTNLTYQWRRNGVPISGATNSSLTLLQVTAALSGKTYDVVVGGDCGQSVTSSAAVLTVNPLPGVFNVIGGGNAGCGPTGLPVSLSGSQQGINYQLKKDGVNAGSPVPGTGNSINFGNQLSGKYTVTAINPSTSCISEMSGKAIITQTGVAPAKPGTISPAANVKNFCGGNYIFSIAAVPGADSYIWTPVPGGSVISNNGTTATLSFPPDFVTGTVSVSAANGCGQSKACNLKANGFTKPVGIDGDDIVSAKEEGLVYNVINPDPTTTYRWTLPGGVDSVTSNFPQNSSITVNWRKTSGTIKVAVQNSCGTSNAVSLLVTVSSSLVAKSGAMEVKSNDISMSVSPNPTNGKVWISFTAHAKQTYTIAVRDVLGKLLLYKDGITVEGKNQAEIDISNRPNAVYFVTLVNQEVGQKTMKLIKGK